MPAGSERYWLFWFMDTDTRVAPGNALGGDYARFLGFEDGAPEGYTALDFNFDTDPVRLEANARLLNAMDPNLSAFRNAGGKYLMYHGWSDPLVLPDQSAEYYENVVTRMGGEEATREFFRLFMIPGMGHCWETPSATPDRFDPISMLENWVEDNEAPEQVSATTLNPEAAEVPAAAICTYPNDPVYLGSISELKGDECSKN